MKDTLIQAVSISGTNIWALVRYLLTHHSVTYAPMFWFLSELGIIAFVEYEAC